MLVAMILSSLWALGRLPGQLHASERESLSLTPLRCVCANLCGVDVFSSYVIYIGLPFITSIDSESLFFYLRFEEDIKF